MKTESHHNQQQPEQRNLKLTLFGFQSDLALLIYRGNKGTLIIATPSQMSRDINLQRTEIEAIATCELYRVDPRTVLWLEHHVSDGHDVYHRVDFDLTVALDRRAEFFASLRNPKHTSIEAVSLRELLRGVGYMPEGETP